MGVRGVAIVEQGMKDVAEDMFVIFLYNLVVVGAATTSANTTTSHLMR